MLTVNYELLQVKTLWTGGGGDLYSPVFLINIIL